MAELKSTLFAGMDSPKLLRALMVTTMVKRLSTASCDEEKGDDAGDDKGEIGQVSSDTSTVPQPETIVAGGIIYEITPFEEFNSKSYFLSNKSQIMPYKEIISSATIGGIDTQLSMSCQHNNAIMWRLNPPAQEDQPGGESPAEPDIPGITTKGSGASPVVAKSFVYKYFAFPVWDVERRIIGQKIEITHYIGNDKPNTETIVNTYGQSGVLIDMGSSIATSQYRVMLRIYRTESLDGAITRTEYVNLPIIATCILYDNGISVAGFKWKPVVDGSFESALFHGTELYNDSIESISIKEGRNIVCFGNEIPEEGQWQANDILIFTKPDNYYGRSAICVGNEGEGFSAHPIWEKM